MVPFESEENIKMKPEPETCFEYLDQEDTGLSCIKC